MEKSINAKDLRVFWNRIRYQSNYSRFVFPINRSTLGALLGCVLYGVLVSMCTYFINLDILRTNTTNDAIQSIVLTDALVTGAFSLSISLIISCVIKAADSFNSSDPQKK